MSNPYYNPEELGLTTIKELEEPNLSYEFHILVLWRHESGKLYWAEDSGCSCPSPFEDFQSVSDLQPLPETVADFVEAVTSFSAPDPDKVDTIRLGIG